MTRIIKFFQENPYVVLITVILGLGGGIIGAVTGWSQFYIAMTTKVSVSGWVVLLVFLAFVTVVIVADGGRDKGGINMKKLIRYEGKAFGVQTVSLDGKDFVRCDFNGTRLVFGAKSRVGLSHCNLQNVSFMFNEHAELTVELLTALYRDMPGSRPMIDATFEAIKSGTLPIAPPVFKE